MSERRSRSATWALFFADHLLLGFRGVTRTLVRASSTLRGTLSIQPTQSASSTTSFQVTVPPAVRFVVTIHAPFAVAW